MSGNPPMALDDGPEQDWSTRAAHALLALANDQYTFTADDLREAVGEPPHPNMAGAAFSAARSMKLILRVGYTVSKAGPRKGGLIRVWTKRIQPTK